jgi:glycosyltransferase involved in cell wall biosynthesis
LWAGHGRKFSLQLLGSNHWDRYVEDDYQRELNRLVAALAKLGVSVRRPGHVGRAELPNEIRKAQIHVMPSRWDEPCALATMEGMACGLATIASATGGTPEIVGHAGLLFQRDSVRELAGHLMRLLDQPGERRTLGEAARRRAQEFTWRRTWRSVAAAAWPSQDEVYGRRLE